MVVMMDIFDNEIEHGEPQLETVTILKTEYDIMIDEIHWLRCLEVAGVDNWSGFDRAIDILEESRGEDD